MEETETTCLPREIFYFKGKVVSWLSAGSNHSLALTIEGYSYSWGKNDQG